jgi:O-methyltransferase
MKQAIKRVVRSVAPPIVKHVYISRWPGWLGRTLDVKVPKSVIHKDELSPAGQANINIMLSMIDRTKHLPGEIADAGVFRGASTVAMALYLRQNGINKSIYAFDSFEGFPEEADADHSLGGAENEDRTTHGFNGTSATLVRTKLASFDLDDEVVLMPGYFNKTFALMNKSPLRFCFASLDVNLYESYKECLEFFYPRMVLGGILLIDEYNDPPWPGCNKAVDEFLVDKLETLQVAENNDYQKSYLVKQ